MISTRELMRLEVDWYRKNGKYPLSRITVNRDGFLYVIGDYSWNRINPQHKEFIEPAMRVGVRV